MKANKEGFSFIELLISVTIILVLSSVATLAFRSANKRARDDRRKADLEKTRAALELYRVDNDEYPITSSFSDLMDDYLSIGSDPYLNESPADPKADNYNYYYSSIDGSSYDVCAYFEATDPGDSCGDCGDEVCNYKLENP